MNTLLRSVRIHDHRSPHDGRTADVRIGEGRILEIGTDLSLGDDREMTPEDAWLSPGWVDSNCLITDPGEEHKEDISSGLAAAMRGGFTDVVQLPNTNPVTDSKAQVSYVLDRAERIGGARLLPAAALSRGCAGQDLAEIYDLFGAGAVAVTDGDAVVRDAGLLQRALRYTLRIDAVVMTRPDDRTISGAGQVHEGAVSVRTGLRGMPAMAEEVMVMRDIRLAEYTGGRLHILSVSTAGAVDLVRSARARGVHVTAGVNAHHLLLTDREALGFDPVYKVDPPLRGEDDRAALLDGLRDGTIQVIASGHRPQHRDDKLREFDTAAFGISSLETTFATAIEALGTDEEAVRTVIRALTDGPRDMLDLDHPVIDAGQPVSATLFSPTSEVTHTADRWVSRSRSNPFIDRPLHGRVIRIFT